MKKIFTLLAGLAFAATSFAQSPVVNGEFENVTGTNADGWTQVSGKVAARADLEVQNQAGVRSLLKAHSGMYSLEVSNTTVVGIAASDRFSINTRPKSLRFETCYLRRGDAEGFGVFIYMTKWNDGTKMRDTLYARGVVIPVTVFPWTSTTIPLYDTSWKHATDVPDSAAVVLVTSSTTQKIQGSLLWVDNLKFTEFALSNNEIQLETVSAVSAYPNPANGTNNTVNYTLHTNSNVKIGLYDIQGRKVRDVLNEEQTYGEHTATADIAGLTSGVYFYRIETEHSVESVKLLVE